MTLLLANIKKRKKDLKKSRRDMSALVNPGILPKWNRIEKFKFQNKVFIGIMHHCITGRVK